ncbi:hypothetical protein GCM10020219_017620 [Nonomuraea dietziae]
MLTIMLCEGAEHTPPPLLSADGHRPWSDHGESTGSPWSDLAVEKFDQLRDYRSALRMPSSKDQRVVEPVVPTRHLDHQRSQQHVLMSGERSGSVTPGHGR